MGLSRITAQQEEENRARSPQRQQQHEEEIAGVQENVRSEELTPPVSSPVISNRMQFPLQSSFGESEFTFRSPFVRDMKEYPTSLAFPGDDDVTYEVIDNQNNNGERGRKRGVSHPQQQQLGSIWDVAGLSNKRSRHM